MAITLSPTMTVMTNAVKKASRALIRDFGEVENLQISRKGPSDFVSTADLKSEKTLHAELSKARPNFGFLMEEGGTRDGKDSDSRWIIDPLDGTTNFLHGLPHWCIAVALETKGEIVAGVIFDPVKDEMFWAEKGKGAFVNAQRLRVAARRELEEALVVTGIHGKGRPNHDIQLKEIEVVANNVAGIRRLGSAALD